ncbi:MAG: hypothetical protein ACFB51_14175 [Anaerolineae bacterium]
MSLDDFYNTDDDPTAIAASLEPNEAYWSALLQEGEHPGNQVNNGHSWENESESFYDAPLIGNPATIKQDWHTAAETFETD